MADVGIDRARDVFGHSADRKAYLQAARREGPQGMLTVLGLLFATCIMGVAVIFALMKGISVANLTRDAAAVLGGPAYIGFASNVGIVLWIAAGVSALLGGYLAPRIGLDFADRSYLQAAGALSLMLGFDDLFMLHEDILPRLGIPQALVLAGYAGVAALFAFRFCREIMSGASKLFLLAGLFLGGSLAIDLAFPFSDLEAAVEDGSKLFGITFWFLFVLTEVVTRLTPERGARLSG